MAKSKARYKPNRISSAEVLDWLEENHPELRQSAVIDRAWVWLADVNLKDKPDIRKSLLGFGFTWKRKGAHALPDGREATWSHSCLQPRPFHQRKGKGRNPRPFPSDEVEDELLAEANELLASL